MPVPFAGNWIAAMVPAENEREQRQTMENEIHLWCTVQLTSCVAFKDTTLVESKFESDICSRGQHFYLFRGAGPKN